MQEAAALVALGEWRLASTWRKTVDSAWRKRITSTIGFLLNVCMTINNISYTKVFMYLHMYIAIDTMYIYICIYIYTYAYMYTHPIKPQCTPDLLELVAPGEADRHLSQVPDVLE